MSDTTLTLREYLDERDNDNVILFFTSVGTPMGEETPLGHPDFDLSWMEDREWFDLTGTLDEEDDWNWNGEGDPADASANTVTKMYAFVVDDERWESFNDDNDEAEDKTTYHTCYAWSPPGISYAEALQYAQAKLDKYGESDWSNDESFSADEVECEYLAKKIERSAFSFTMPSLWRFDIEADEDFIWSVDGPKLCDPETINLDDLNNITIINRYAIHDDEDFVEAEEDEADVKTTL